MKKILPLLIALSRAAQKATVPCLRLLPVAALSLCLACGAKGPAQEIGRAHV